MRPILPTLFMTVAPVLAHAECPAAVNHIMESTVEVVTDNSRGTGFSYNGYIITNYHVISNRRTNDIKIFTPSNDWQYGEVIAEDKFHDIAIMKVSNNYKSVTFGNSIDDKVISIGNVDGRGLAVLSGYVKGYNETVTHSGVDLYGIMKTNIPFHHGNSGGPVFNCNGQVVGMADARNVEYGEVVGYVIPAEQIKKYVAKFENNHKLGISIVSSNEGVRVYNVTEEPAINYNISPGDVIISANGQQNLNVANFVNIVKTSVNVNLIIKRNYKVIRITIPIG